MSEGGVVWETDRVDVLWVRNRARQFLSMLMMGVRFLVSPLHRSRCLANLVVLFVAFMWTMFAHFEWQTTQGLPSIRNSAPGSRPRIFNLNFLNFVGSYVPSSAAALDFASNQVDLLVPCCQGLFKLDASVSAVSVDGFRLRGWVG